MNRLNVDTGYDKIFYCTVCASSKITLESLDNHTVVQVSCHNCDNEYIITLADDED